MIVVGAKGLAKEVLEIFRQNSQLDNLVFFDDVNVDVNDVLFNQFPILKNDHQVIEMFKKINSTYTIGVGNPSLRYKMFLKFEGLGGSLTSVISPLATIGSFEVHIDQGVIVLSRAILSNSVFVGKGCLIYYNVLITHDCRIGDFVELSPGATILGRCKIGNFTHIGANATILPNLTVGQNVVIGAGSVVTKDIPDDVIAYGNPARVITKRESFN